MPTVNPEVLIWARETAGMTQDEAARKIGLADSLKVTAIDKLDAIERGLKEPSRSVLAKMARKYRRPLLSFYLPRPPKKGDRGADFRTIRRPHTEKDHYVVDALIREVRTRQTMVRAVLEAEDEADRLAFVGGMQNAESAPPGSRDSVYHAAATICNVLKLSLPTDYYEQPNPKKAFSLLRSNAESAGVFVLLRKL